ncbi:MAG: radical SAM protein [Aquificaceae bacterium]|nr:MAG: radical SAM protein [Aquificaceae bacterium]
MGEFVPSYLKLYEEGKLKERVELLKETLAPCEVCPHRCGVNRLKGEKGFCKTSYTVRVSSAFLHRGEEKPIRGDTGSGTIFFSYCNMACVYCQNYEISQLGEGEDLIPQELANIMLYLQKEGAVNINLVTPSHVVPQIVEAIYLATQRGLKIPIVYNTSSYDGLKTLKLLEGIVDIYLADLKYLDESIARRYSRVKNYPRVAKEAIKEMYRQVGNLKLDHRGVAYRGLLVRHLVLPNDLSTSFEVMDFLSSLGKGLAVNVMGQYFPFYLAKKFEELAIRPSLLEIERVKAYARQKGLWLIED